MGLVRHAKQADLQHLVDFSVQNAKTTKFPALAVHASGVVMESSHMRIKRSAFRARLVELAWTALVLNARLGWSRTGVKRRSQVNHIRRIVAHAVYWMLDRSNLRA